MLYKSLPLVKKATKEPKLLALQFKIIHHITNCSENLYKWKITQSDKCDYCNNGEKDSMIHALTQCEFTLNGLQDVLKFIDPQGMFIYSLDITHFIFGVEDPALNLIFLIIKKYIIYVRSYKLPFVPQVVVNQILQRICSDKGNLSDRLFCNKWNSFLDMVKLAERYRKSFNVCV